MAAARAAQERGVALRPLGADGLAPYLTESPGPAMEAAPWDTQDDAVILYTSGTTVRPKGVQLTRRNMGTNADSVVDTLIHLKRGETGLGRLPLFPVFGLTCALMTSVTAGATLAMITRFDPDEAVRTIREQQVALFIGMPTMYGAVLAAAKEDSAVLASLRLAVAGGSSLPMELLLRFETTFGCIILEGHDLSETSPAARFNHADAERGPARSAAPSRVANCSSCPRTAPPCPRTTKRRWARCGSAGRT